MRVIGSLASARLRQETILTIGAFDGVHRGHQALVKRVVARAHDTDRLAALITFHPHPAAVVAPDRALRYLTTPADKAALLDDMGMDLLVLLPFDRQMADTPASDFVTAMSRSLRVRELWTGADFALGRNREGDGNHLTQVGRDLGFQVHVAEPLSVEGEVVSSSRIRTALEDGRVEEATRLLGRHYSVSGRAARESARGWVPCPAVAYLDVGQKRAMPAGGVYAAFARLGSQRFPAVADVEVFPRANEDESTVGVHLLGDGTDRVSTDHVYGCHLVAEFVSQLRPAQQCQDTVEVAVQMERDIKDARQVLERILQETGRSHGHPAAAWSLTRVCPYRYEEVEHTADRALSVWGNHLQDLFAGAARGMYSLIADVDGLIATTWRPVQLEDWDRESLLVAWLNELLFLTEAEGLLFVEYRIESLTDTTLEAQVGGMPGPVTKAVIKAATFHDLTVARQDDGWATVVTFDV